MKTKWLPLLMLVLLLAWMGLLFSGCSQDKLEIVKVNEVTHSVFYAPFYAAINLGYFEEEGLQVELTNGGGSDKSMTALLSGQADIGLMGPETAVYVHNEGKEDYAVVIGQLTKRDGSFLLGKVPDPDFDWSKLEGTSVIGGRAGGMPQMTLEYVLKQHGLVDGKNITVRTDVQFNLMGGAFIGGNDDYVTMFEPSASTMELADEGYIVASVGEAGGEVPYTCFMVKKSYLEKNKDLLTGFIRAVYRGQQYVIGSSAQDVAKTLAPSFPDSDVDLLTVVAQRYKDIDVWKSDPVMLEADYGRLLDIIIEAGVIQSGPAYEDLIDNTIAESVRK